MTEAQMTTVKNIAHVTEVNLTLSDRLSSTDSNLVSAIEAGSMGRRFNQNSNNGSTSSDSQNANRPQGTFTPPVTVIGTTSPTNLSTTQGGGTFKLTSGEVFSGTGSEYIALVGKILAEKNNLTVGSTFTAHSTTVKVVGIFDSGNNFSNNQVIMPLAAVQKLTSLDGQITNASVTVDSISNIDSATKAIQTSLGDKADVTNESERAKSSIEPLENIRNIAMISLVGSLIAGSVIILLTMMMIVRERRREIGVLKAIGANNRIVIGQFMVESLTLTLLGTIVGLVIGVFGSNPVTNMLVQNSASTTTTQGPGGGPGLGRMMEFGQGAAVGIRNIQTNVGWDIILYGLTAALLIAVVGSAVPAWFTAKIRPAEVMRAE